MMFHSYVNDNDPGCSPKAWRHTVYNPVAEHQNMVAGKIPPNMWTYLLKIGVACVASKKNIKKWYVNRLIKHSTLRCTERKLSLPTRQHLHPPLRRLNPEFHLFQTFSNSLDGDPEMELGA